MEEEFHNHMRIPWHDYTRKSIGRPITEASLSEKASIIGRTGIMLLSCGTGAWRVRSSMNTLLENLELLVLLILVYYQLNILVLMVVTVIQNPYVCLIQA